MGNVLLNDVFRLPIADRVRVAQAIWDSVAESPEKVELTESQRAELDRCYAEYLADPEEGSDWTEVRARLLARE